jgi:hypothetical protein
MDHRLELYSVIEDRVLTVVQYLPTRRAAFNVQFIASSNQSLMIVTLSFPWRSTRRSAGVRPRSPA